jgi:hypothetical protein
MMMMARRKWEALDLTLSSVFQRQEASPKGSLGKSWSLQSPEDMMGWMRGGRKRREGFTYDSDGNLLAPYHSIPLADIALTCAFGRCNPGGIAQVINSGCHQPHAQARAEKEKQGMREER